MPTKRIFYGKVFALPPKDAGGLSLSPARSVGKTGVSSGFTLLEVLISLVILTTGIVFIFQFLFGSAAALSHIENRVRAHFLSGKQRWNIIKEAGEGIRLLDYHDQVEFDGYPFSVKANLSDDHQLENLRRLTLEISWREGGKDKRIWQEENLRE